MSLTYACNLFGYSRQVYYRSKSRVKQHQQRAEQVISIVQGVRTKMPMLGGKKLYHLLRKELKDMGVGRDKLFDILRANHLLINPKRQYHITTDSHHRFRKHKNLIDGIQVNKPEQVWVSDITYIGNRKNPQYLSLVTDMYSKKIMGYNVSNSLSVSGALSALEMAIKSRKYRGTKLIHHSDRGLQYCSDEYQKLIGSNHIRCSMTEQYDPYQNAIAERVNGILKQEFILGIKIKDIELMRSLIKQSIKIYNNERPRLSCHMHTPNYMHDQCDVVIKTYKRKKPVEDLNPLLVN